MRNSTTTVLALSLLVAGRAAAEEAPEKKKADDARGEIARTSTQAQDDVPAAAPQQSPSSPTGPATRAPLAAEIEKPAATPVHWLAEASVASTYVFRGVPQYNDKTTPSTQNTLSLSYEGLGPGTVSLGVWNATALTDYGDQPGTRLELDVIAGYSMTIAPDVTASVGYIGYLYPHVDPADGAHEIAGTVSWTTPWATPTLGVFAEVARLQGAYVVLGVARDFNLGPILMSPGVGVAVSGYDETTDFGLNDVSARLGGKWTSRAGFYVGASVNYAYNGLDGAGSFADRSTAWGAGFLGFAR